MNYNQDSFRIDRKDFIRGNNSYENYPDGGVTTETVGANAWSKPGLLSNAPHFGSSTTAGLPQSGIISWGIGKESLGLKTMGVGTNDDRDGYFYTVGLNGVLVQSGSADTSQDYKLGWTDTAYYQGSFYTTSLTDIIKNSADLGTRDLSYWVTTKGQSGLGYYSPHPMVVYGDILFIADSQYLHQLDGTTANSQVLDLGNEYIITAMTVYNNLIYIVAEPYWNASRDSHGATKMFTWNGYSPSWIDEWDLNYSINCLYVDRNGIMYMFNKYFMGYWTGSKMQNLWPINSLVFKPQVTSTSDSMFFVDDDTIIRYGTPIPGGTKKFFKSFFSDTRTFVGIVSFQGNRLIASEDGVTNSSVYYISNVNSPSTTEEDTFVFNKRRFTRPVKIRGAVIDTDQLTTGKSYEIKYYDDKNQLITIGEFTATDSSMRNKYTWGFESLGIHYATRSVQPVIVATGGGHIEGVDFLYAPAEGKFNR